MLLNSLYKHHIGVDPLINQKSKYLRCNLSFKIRPLGVIVESSGDFGSGDLLLADDDEDAFVLNDQEQMDDEDAEDEDDDDGNDEYLS